jgi:hypothetical protein
MCKIVVENIKALVRFYVFQNVFFRKKSFFDDNVTQYYYINRPEIDRNRMAMGLPPVTSAVFLIAN